jgi:hypothetical protein
VAEEPYAAAAAAAGMLHSFFFPGIQQTYVHATRFEGRFPCPFSFRFSKSQSQECESLKWVSRSLLLLLPSTVCIPRALLMVQMFVGISARLHFVPTKQQLKCLHQRWSARVNTSGSVLETPLHWRLPLCRCVLPVSYGLHLHPELLTIMYCVVCLPVM